MSEPKCLRCGASEFRINGYCSVYCEDMHEVETELAGAMAYADKLAQGLPEGMLPKDVEILREGNAQLADENLRLKAQVEALREQVKDLSRRLWRYRNRDQDWIPDEEVDALLEKDG